MNSTTEKNILILGGGGVTLPPTDRPETTTETRALAAEITLLSINATRDGSGGHWGLVEQPLTLESPDSIMRYPNGKSSRHVSIAHQI